MELRMDSRQKSGRLEGEVVAPLEIPTKVVKKFQKEASSVTEWQMAERVTDFVEEERAREREKEDERERREFVVHVPLPDEKEIERRVLEKKKKDLLSRYASEGLVEEQTEAKDMLNIQR